MALYRGSNVTGRKTNQISRGQELFNYAGLDANPYNTSIPPLELNRDSEENTYNTSFPAPSKVFKEREDPMMRGGKQASGLYQHSIKNDDHRRSDPYAMTVDPRGGSPRISGYYNRAMVNDDLSRNRPDTKLNDMSVERSAFRSPDARYPNSGHNDLLASRVDRVSHLNYGQDLTSTKPTERIGLIAGANRLDRVFEWQSSNEAFQDRAPQQEDKEIMLQPGNLLPAGRKFKHPLSSKDRLADPRQMTNHPDFTNLRQQGGDFDSPSFWPEDIDHNGVSTRLTTVKKFSLTNDKTIQQPSFKYNSHQKKRGWGQNNWILLATVIVSFLLATAVVFILVAI